MKKIHIILLILIFSLGAFIRIYKLGEVPSSLNWDEVSWGYNAYSIAETGRDEHGKHFPLSFEAFGDYKQPIYVYSQVPAIKLFGLNAFAVRFPSAFFGSLTIISVFFLTLELFENLKSRHKLALLVSLFFALSPWSIQFSRVAFEANVATFFIITGAWLFLKGINDRKFVYLAFSLLIISFSSFTYHSAKIFTPLLVGSLFLINYKYFLANKKTAIVLAVIYLLINSIWIADMRTTSRGRSVLFTSHQTEILKRSIPYLEKDSESVIPINNIIHNRRVIYINKYLENYLSHFDPNFLFIKGDNARHHAPGMGVLYLALFPAIIIGIFKSMQMKGGRKWVLFSWFLLAPVASSLAVDAPNASRSLAFVPTWQIFAALGTLSIFQHFRKRKIILFILALIFIANVIYYLEQYFVHTNIEQAEYWQHGYKDAVEFANQQDTAVLFTDTVEQAYIFYLFHTNYPPEKYLGEGGSGMRKNKCYSIENTFYGDCRLEESHFIIADEGEDVDEERVKIIYLPNGEEAIKIYRNYGK